MIRNTAEKRLRLVIRRATKSEGRWREWNSQRGSTACLYLISLKRGESMRPDTNRPQSYELTQAFIF